MRSRVVTFVQFAALMMAVSFVLPSSSNGEVFWEETFENHLTPNWDTGACGIAQPPDGCNPGISTGIAYNGTRSLKSHFVGNHVQAGTYLDRYHPPTTNVYTRHYYYTVNFAYDTQSATKDFYQLSAAGGIDGLEIWYGHAFGSRELFAQLTVAVDNPSCPGRSCNFYANAASVPLADNRWYCIETHVNAGTPNVANGVIEVWVDGVQTLQYTNVLMSFSANAVWNLVRPYAQYGDGDRYMDNFAVGNTRIGCAGGAPGPNPPIGLTTK